MRLRLLTTKDCHLCGAARDALARVAADAKQDWEEIDVAEDAELAREYGDRLPVVLLDGKEHSYWTVDGSRLRRDLGASPNDG